jgi:hypothetical protein
MATEPGSSGFASGNPSNLTDKLSVAAGEAKSRAADLGRKADSADQARSSAAAGRAPQQGRLRMARMKACTGAQLSHR